MSEPQPCPMLLGSLPLRLDWRQNRLPPKPGRHRAAPGQASKSPKLLLAYLVPCISLISRCQSGPEALQGHQANSRLKGHNTRVRHPSRFLKVTSCAISCLPSFSLPEQTELGPPFLREPGLVLQGLSSLRGDSLGWTQPWPVGWRWEGDWSGQGL